MGNAGWSATALRDNLLMMKATKGLYIYLNIISTCGNRSRHCLVLANLGDYNKNLCFYYFLICFSLEHKVHFPKDSLCNHYFNKRFQGSSKLFQLVWSLILATGAIICIIMLT